MSSRVFSQASLDYLDTLPSARRAPGVRIIPTSCFSSSPPSSPEQVITVPEDLNSLEFLLFVGFDKTIARTIWRVWQQRGERPHWVIDYARHYIREQGREFDAAGQDGDWDGALRNMGLSADLRRRILNPAFDQIRLLQSAREWALDSINLAMDFLQSLEGRLQRKRAQMSRSNEPADDSSVPVA